MHVKVRRRYGQKGWVLKVWENGKERYLPRDQYPAGIRAEMTIEQARKRIQAHNAATRPPSTTSRLKAARRHRNRMALKHVLLPEDAVLLYEKLNILFLKDDDPTRRQRELIWTAAQNLICELGLHPSDWSLSPDAIYAYLAKKGYSWDYCKRIVSTMNRYGQIYCRLMRSGFYALELRDQKKRAVIEANFGEGRESEPLAIAALRALEQKVPPNKYNWLWIAFWFGMRPQEVDMLKARQWRDGMPSWWLEDDEKTLVVYQPKLQMVKPKKRYRRIPLKFPEQMNALGMIKSGCFERPSVKEASRWFPPGVSLYGCRHGFACYMDMRGIDIFAISRWLGHHSVKTTERYYVRLGMKREVIAGKLFRQESFGFDLVDFLKSLLKAIFQLMPRPSSDPTAVLGSGKN